MENGGLCCDSLELRKMPALSNETSPSSSKEEFLRHINNPEDVGAVVTSICKIVEHENGQSQVKIENIEQDSPSEPLQEPILTKPKPKDIVVCIKDENSRSSTTDEEDFDAVKEEITYEEIKEEDDQKEVKCDKVAQNGQQQSTSKDAIKVDMVKRSESYEEDEEDEEIDDDEEEEDEDSDPDSDPDESGSEPSITKSTLRARPRNAHADKVRAQREIVRQISQIVRKTEKGTDLSAEENNLLKAHPKVFDDVSSRHKKRKTTEMRKQEIEDSPTVLAKKCERMAKAIQKAKYLIVYTGAGISTAANIPDYRGPNGVWTCLDQGNLIPFKLLLL